MPSLGPLQWSLRSPWMIAAIAAPGDLKALDPAVTAYVDQWLQLVDAGLPEPAAADARWQDLAERDRRNRAAMFSPAANPVWFLLDRLVGPEQSSAMRGLLTTQG